MKTFCLFSSFFCIVVLTFYGAFQTNKPTNTNKEFNTQNQTNSLIRRGSKTLSNINYQATEQSRNKMSRGSRSKSGNTTIDLSSTKPSRNKQSRGTR